MYNMRTLVSEVNDLKETQKIIEHKLEQSNKWIREHDKELKRLVNLLKELSI